MARVEYWVYKTKRRVRFLNTILKISDKSWHLYPNNVQGLEFYERIHQFARQTGLRNKQHRIQYGRKPWSCTVKRVLHELGRNHM